MIYQYTNVENIIGRVIRNTKLSDTSAYNDLPEWIAEAMELLQTSMELEPDTETVRVKFFQARMPNGLVELEAVENCGTRMMFDNSSNFTQRESPSSRVRVSKMDDRVLIDSKERSPREAKSMKYFLKPGYVCTYFREGEITLHYKRYACDENGFPLIPDNGNYKEAIYWFLRGRLIGSGQLDDRNNTEDKCLQYFEKYGARAIGEITYPSVDKMERVRANQLQFVLPENYWNNFSSL